MNDRGYTSTPPIYDRHPGVSHAQTRAHAHTHGGWPRASPRFITRGKERKKGKSFSDECWKDSEPVKGDAQPNTGGAFVWREGRKGWGGAVGGVMRG